jgi:pimeloyl-ACP methyl ester carboxylesterase
LLTPTLCELEWRIKPQLDEWAEVATYDAPGVGADRRSAFSHEAIAERGLTELERRAWDRCVVVGDEFGCLTAARVAAARPDVVEGLALGHPTLSLRSDGERPPISGQVMDAFVGFARTDYGAYVRALSQITQHAYDDEFADAYRVRVPREVAVASHGALFEADEKEPIETVLRKLDVPLLFVEHKGCLLFTPEGFEDAVAAFPSARTASMNSKPSASPEFAALIREFCEGLPAGEEAKTEKGLGA